MLAAAVIAVVVGGIALRIAFDDSTTPISAAEIVERFRAEAMPVAPPATATEVPVATPRPRVVPAQPGVYLYVTTGQEAVDALGGATHLYPAETTVTLRSAGCGISYRWDALAERTEEWVLCEGPEGLSLDRYESLHRFFGQDDREDLACPERVLLVPADPVPGDTWTGSCAGDRVEEQLAVTVVGLGPERVDGAEVEVVEIRVEVGIGSADDSISGGSVSRYWFAAGSGLLVRWSESTQTVAGSFVGDVTYEEGFDVALAQLEPLT